MSRRLSEDLLALAASANADETCDEHQRTAEMLCDQVLESIANPAPDTTLLLVSLKRRIGLARITLANGLHYPGPVSRTLEVVRDSMEIADDA